MLGEGLSAGLRHLGVDCRTLLHAEREAYPTAVLAARMEEGSLDAAPIWFGDFTELDATRFRGVVDCVVAGFPCQDLSVAGRRAGLDGQRSGLFFEVVRIATDSGAWLLFLENVAGIASATASVVDPEEGELDERAAARVVGELADLGWDAEWITLAASDVGASHGRARWFCLAWRVGHAGLQHQQLQQRQRGRAAVDGGDCAVAYTEGDGQAGRQRISAAPGAGAEPGPVRHGAAMAYAGDERQPEPVGGGHARPHEQPHGLAELVAGGDALPLFAPGPADPRWPAILAEHPELAPALEPAFRRVVDGLAFDMGDSRAARLKCVGNGVVALQAAAAFVVLARRAAGVSA